MKKNGRTNLGARGWLAIACTCAGLAGCVTKPKGHAQNTYTGGEGQEMEKRVGSSGFARELEILRPISRRDESGRLLVQFELHNKKTQDLAFEYAVTWKDASGFAIDTPWHWRPMSIVGQGYRTVSVTGPTPEAVQWELHVQPSSSVR